MDFTMTELEPFEPALVRLAFSQFPSGIVALCAEIDGKPAGLVASSFTAGVSMRPPLVLFAAQNSSTTWPRLRRAGRIGVSVLGSDHDAVCRRLASPDRDERFKSLDSVTTDNGAVLIVGSVLWLECEISSETPAGDHHVVVMEVKALRIEPEAEPLVFHGSAFRQLLIPSAQD